MDQFRNFLRGVPRVSIWSLGFSLMGFLGAQASRAEDPYLWLEEVESDRALTWVQSHNDKTLNALQQDPHYANVEKDIRQIVLAKDRIPSVRYQGGALYHFWQDRDHVRGVWRRTSLEEFQKADPTWDLLLDIDALAVQENENWVWKGASCLPPLYQRCMVSLSRGGKDAHVMREYDLVARRFVSQEEKGFQLAEAKSRIAWLNANTLLVGTDLGEGSLTSSGYPRLIKKWVRGKSLEEAPLLFQGHAEDVSAEAEIYHRPEGKTVIFHRSLSFFEEQNWLWTPKGGTQLVPFPKSAQLQGVVGDRIFALLRDPWSLKDRTLPAGALVSWARGKSLSSVEVVFEGGPRMTIEGVVFGKNSLFLTVLDQVRGRVIRLNPGPSGWQAERQDYPDHGSLSISSLDPTDGRMLVDYQNYLVPKTLYLSETESLTADGRAPQVLKQGPRRFDETLFEIEQKESVSQDGTRIPYFLVHPKGMPLDGSHPTLLYGYGGFEVSQTPFYLSTWGKVWLERGGSLAFANIRGGGEFGPAWHQAAIQEKRQTSFDDFISVAEHLIQTGVTSSKRLAIMGGSNGGLLVGAVFVQRPDLFQAVIDQVPLLDMMRYHKLLAGASWIAEYGNPDEPKMAEAILKYSPYQNLKPSVTYPKVFFVTSTKDDRVHPGHARKMAAKMEEYGHPFDYFENRDGGHSASANLEETIHRTALEFTFLLRELLK